VPRPPLPVGTPGTILITEIGPGKYEARSRFRDYDGATRQVRAVGKSKTAAGNNLKAKIRDRQGPAGTVITDQTRMRDLADSWLTASHSPEWSTGTRDTYTYIVKNNVKPALGDLRIGEAKVAVINRAIDVIKLRHGLGAAKSTKTVLSGMFKHAITHEACEVNPIRDATSVPRKKSTARALTVEQTEEITDGLRASQVAVDYDLPDLVDWMLYTGCRIGEACAAREETNIEGEPLIDHKHGTWEVNATVIRVMGAKRLKALEEKTSRTWEEDEELVALRTLTPGLHVQPRTKTEAGWRILALPPGAIAMLERRRTELRMKAPRGIVFGAPAARALRDPRNTNRELRKALDALGCEVCNGTGLIEGVNRKGKPAMIRCEAGPFSWVTSHTFRKTVATRLEEAGCTPRQVADQLGHARPSMTMDVYFGRNVVNAAAAKILDR